MASLEHQAEEDPRPSLRNKLALLALVGQRRHKRHATTEWQSKPQPLLTTPTLPGRLPVGLLANVERESCRPSRVWPEEVL
eukprot:8952958-Alexandrium_andersonii.AAC.1